MCFKQGKVERFSLDPSLGEFIHTHADVQFPADGGKKIYSCNEGARRTGGSAEGSHWAGGARGARPSRRRPSPSCSSGGGRTRTRRSRVAAPRGTFEPRRRRDCDAAATRLRGMPARHPRRRRDPSPRTIRAVPHLPLRNIHVAPAAVPRPAPTILPADGARRDDAARHRATPLPWRRFGRDRRAPQVRNKSGCPTSPAARRRWRSKRPRRSPRRRSRPICRSPSPSRRRR